MSKGDDDFGVSSDGEFNPALLPGYIAEIDYTDASTLFIDAGVTPVSADDDPIYRSYDKSGNGLYLEQATLANRGKYKIGIQNGQSVCRVDGSSYYVAGGGWPTTAQPLTIFAAARYNSIANSNTLFDSSARVLMRISSMSFAQYAGAFATFAVGNTNPNIFSLIYDGANSDAYINGGADLQANNPSTASLSSLRLFTDTVLSAGSFFPAGSDAYVFLVYSGHMLDVNRIPAQNYLSEKLGIPVT